MVVIVYDGTFPGWLTTVFEVFEHRYINVDIVPERRWKSVMFGDKHTTVTNDTKAQRVWKGLTGKISVRALTQLYKAFLSENKGIEVVLLKYVQYVFESKRNVESDFSHHAVLLVTQTAKKVDREKHRMEAFIRFKLSTDGLYSAVCQPDFNVLPLITKHFQDRYADQRWLIYDVARKYGIYYDLKKVETVTLTVPGIQGNMNSVALALDEKEELYQQLWQQYFSSVNIEARRNLKLHIQHMPKRYWQFLPEKQYGYK